MDKSESGKLGFWKQYRTRLKEAKQSLQDEDYESVLEKNLNLIRELVTLSDVARTENDLKTLERLQGAIEGRISDIYALYYDKKINYNKKSLVALLKKELHGQGINVEKSLKLARYKAKTRKPLYKLKGAAINDEDVKTEFKKSFRLKDAIAKTIVSFANTKGGKVYIGIAEKENIDERDDVIKLNDNFFVVGVYTNTDDHRQKLMAFIQAHTNIDTSLLKVSILSHETKNVVVVAVPQLLAKYGELSFFKGDAYIRVDNQNKKLSSQEAYELLRHFQVKTARTRHNITKLEIKEASDELIVEAYYSDGTKVQNFRGYWFGWQTIKGKGAVWTPLGFGKSKIPKPNNFTEIHVYKDDNERAHTDPSSIKAVWPTNDKN